MKRSKLFRMIKKAKPPKKPKNPKKPKQVKQAKGKRGGNHPDKHVQVITPGGGGTDREAAVVGKGSSRKVLHGFDLDFGPGERERVHAMLAEHAEMARRGMVFYEEGGIPGLRSSSVLMRRERVRAEVPAKQGLKLDGVVIWPGREDFCEACGEWVRDMGKHVVTAEHLVRVALRG